MGGAELAVGNVLGDGRVEKIDLLTYYRDLVAPPCEIKLRQSDSIDKQTPRRRIVKAADKLIKLDLPAPEGPTKAVVSPTLIEQVTCWSAAPFPAS